MALADVLHIPNPVISPICYSTSALETLALTCAQMCSPEDQWALVTKYRRSQAAISQLTHEVVSYINNAWGHLLRFDKDGILSPEALTQYTAMLHAHGAPTRMVVGFLDCTIRKTCCPSFFKTLAYMGYKKFHGMKFQAIAVPNGMIAHLDGPYCTPQNDGGVLVESRLLKLMREHAIQPGLVEGDPSERRYFQLYGDSAYGVSAMLVSPHAWVRELTAVEHAWNTAMGGVRISVEHVFGIVLQEWTFLRCSWKHQILGTACGLWYRVAVLLTNAHNCFVPNQTAQCYGCMPPSIADYFHN